MRRPNDKGKILLLLFFLLCLRGPGAEATRSAYNWLYPLALAGRTIVVDPGHGGVDPGAHYQAQILEKDLVLDLGRSLARFLEAEGAEVVLTRSEDRDLAPPEVRSLSARKRYDLKARVELVRQVGAEAFLSLHINSSPDSSEKGVYLYYSQRPGSRELASALAEEIGEVTGQRCCCLPGSRYYVLRESPVPAVLVEAGFLSNPGERELLQRPEYRQKMAWALSCGVYRYFAGRNSPGRGN
ncbi:N-acetylmuramoyl-L-alanine amidase family protein [Desulfothermobacter acidiphilus]|uniref:N-acetylmuramoyl-L-alanine amidase family protein n=1 Tax=Desulfothermobacter acidiphilus TaxID=1938353 RepID=UPI003F8AAE52